MSSAASGLRIENLALVKGGTSLSLEVMPGQAIAVVGTAGSGKTALLRVLASQLRPALGSFSPNTNIRLLDERQIPKRGRLDSLARMKGGASVASRASEALTICGLWEDRAASVADASPGQLAAMCLLPAFCEDSPVVMIDMLIDLIDPKTRRDVLAGLSKNRREQGVIHLISTNQVDIIEQCDGVVVMKDSSFRASSSIEALRSRTVPGEVIIETTRSHAIRSMVEPFAIKVTETAEGLRVETFEGQEMAQKLMIAGYGDVRCTLIRRPSLGDVLASLL
jgi:ABC-type multidrug transport system ATPase subunit